MKASQTITNKKVKINASSLKKFMKFFWPLLIGLIIWFTFPLRPVGVSLTAWHALAIFVATIIACITQPLPLVGVTIVGLSSGVVLGIFSMKAAVSGFGNTTIWLIAMAYLISRGFIKTGLSRRIALIFIRYFGEKTLSLSYSLAAIDLITAPAMPSNTARVGGVVYPIITSLNKTYGSDPKNKTQRNIGSYLIFSSLHINIITSAMFLTGMAPNLLIVSIAKTMGVNISWITWFLAALVPGIICLISVPYIIYKIYPPKVKQTPKAKNWAENELNHLGKFTPSEKIMLGTFILALVLWILSDVLNIDPTLVAFIAISILLLTGVLKVDDILNEKGAWNVLIWFSVVMFMANQLTSLGFIPWLAKSVGHIFTGFNWLIVLIILCLFYLYSHYLFAGSTAHASAMFGSLLAVALSVGVPPVLAVLAIGFTGSFFNSTTPYAAGPSTILYGSGYIKQADWWKYNFLLGLYYLLIWLILGVVWMKIIGIW